MTRMTVCAVDGCGELIPRGTRGRRCLAHRRALEDERGTRQARGYGADHDTRRRQLAPIVDSGNATCSRCGRPIHAGEAWDLGHVDGDRTRYAGPEHAACNRAAPRRR